MIQALIRASALALSLASSGFAQSFCWSESTDNVVIQPIGVSCAYGPPGTVTTDNSFWRRYNPAARGMQANFSVTQVNFGVAQALSGPGGQGQTATLNLWRDPTPGDPAPRSELVLLGSEAVFIPDFTVAGLLTYALSTPVDCSNFGGDDLVLELALPDGMPTQSGFFYGGNSAGQSSPTYLSSTACGIPEPLDVAAIGFPSSHMLFDVCGVQTSDLSTVYCTAKTNSLGCIPSIAYLGIASATASSGFLLHAEAVINVKPGLLLYGNSGRAATPFQGGTLCVSAPLQRSSLIHSGGNPLPNDCTGTYVIDLNSFARGLLGGSPAPFLGLQGTVVNAQFWGRDNGFPAPDASTLSNAVEFVVGA